MATPSNIVSSPQPDVGATLSGSVCIASEPPSPSICHMELSPPGNDHERTEHELDDDQGQIVYQSTVEPHLIDCEEVTINSECSNNDHPKLAIGSLVPTNVAVDPYTSASATHSERLYAKRSRPSDKESALVIASMEHTPSPAKRSTFSNNKLIKQYQEKFVQWLYDRGEEEAPITASLIFSYIQERSSQNKW